MLCWKDLERVLEKSCAKKGDDIKLTKEKTEEIQLYHALPKLE